MTKMKKISYRIVFVSNDERVWEKRAFLRVSNGKYICIRIDQIGKHEMGYGINAEEWNHKEEILK